VLTLLPAGALSPAAALDGALWSTSPFARRYARSGFRIRNYANGFGRVLEVFLVMAGMERAIRSAD